MSIETTLTLVLTAAILSVVLLLRLMTGALAWLASRLFGVSRPERAPSGRSSRPAHRARPSSPALRPGAAGLGRALAEIGRDLGALGMDVVRRGPAATAGLVRSIRSPSEGPPSRRVATALRRVRTGRAGELVGAARRGLDGALATGRELITPPEEAAPPPGSPPYNATQPALDYRSNGAADGHAQVIALETTEAHGQHEEEVEVQASVLVLEAWDRASESR